MGEKNEHIKRYLGALRVINARFILNDEPSVIVFVTTGTIVTQVKRTNNNNSRAIF
jgi:hypothetical protein